MPKIVYIKQKPGKVAEHFGLNNLKDGVSVYPESFQRFNPRVESFESWVLVTGLNENSSAITTITDTAKRKAKQKEIIELRTDLESKLNVDLNVKSDYWKEYSMVLVERQNAEKKLDLDRPEDKLLLTVALANYFVAPTYEDLDEPEYEKCFLYVFNPVSQSSRKVVLQELKDEASAIIFPAKNNEEKLFYWCFALGKAVNKQMSRSDLYQLIATHRESLTNVDKLQAFIDVLSLSNEELKLRYCFNLATKKKVITKVQGQYTMDNEPLGATEAESYQKLLSPQFNYLADKLYDLE